MGCEHNAEECVQKISDLARVLGDRNRVRVLCMLAQNGAMSACRLLEQLEINQPTLSHHMRVLSEAGLVRVRRVSRWTEYSLCAETLDDYAVLLGCMANRARVQEKQDA